MSFLRKKSLDKVVVLNKEYGERSEAVDLISIYHPVNHGNSLVGLQEF